MSGGLITSTFTASARPALPLLQKSRIAFRIAPLLPLLVLPAAVVSQVVVDQRLAPVPNVKPWFKGVLNQRGNMCPVFDVAAWMGHPQADASARVLMISPGPMVIAILCIGLPEIVELQRSTEISTDHPMASICMDAFATDKGEVYQFDPLHWLRRVGPSVTGREVGV